MPRSARPRSAIPAGAVASAEKRSHRTLSPQHGSGNITKTKPFLNILTGKDGKTPAERLGLAQVPLDYEDIIYFTSTD
jgi:hypothetical protein